MKNRFLKALTSLVLVTIMVASLVPVTMLNIFAAEQTYVATDLADIKATDTVIIVATYTDGTSWALSSANGASKAPGAIVVTDSVAGNTLAIDPAVTTAIEWNIANDNGNLTIYPAGTTDTWLYCTSTNNGVRVGTNANSIFTMDASGYLKNTATSRYLGVYRTNPDWRCYNNTTGNTANQTFTFYVLQTGDPDCQHTNTEVILAVDPTCTEAGTTAGLKCSDCGFIITAPETADPATGHTLGADGVCTVCSAKVKYTIPETLAADNGTKVVVSGQVCLINEAWSSYNNMSVTIKDENDNELYLYRLSTQVVLGDIITVTGTVGSYNGNKQIGQGATATIDGHEDLVVNYDEVTIEEAIASDDGRLVTFSGVVTGVDYDWNGTNMSVDVTDNAGNSIYLYKLGSEVVLGDIITVKGIVGSYNGNKQIVSATAEITGSVNPVVKGFSLALNKGITVKVTITVSEMWLSYNADAKIVFSNGTEHTAIAGTNVYTTDLTPGVINDALTVTVNGTATDVSFASYKAKVEATETTGKLNLSDEKYAALINLLGAIESYANTVDQTETPDADFINVQGIQLFGDTNMLTGIDATLAEAASLSIGFNTADYDLSNYSFSIQIGENVVSSGAISGGKININGFYPVHFDDYMSICILDETNGQSIAVSIAFTFNDCLKTFSESDTVDASVKYLANAAYNYGVAAENYAGAQ